MQRKELPYFIAAGVVIAAISYWGYRRQAQATRKGEAGLARLYVEIQPGTPITKGVLQRRVHQLDADDLMVVESDYGDMHYILVRTPLQIGAGNKMLVIATVGGRVVGMGIRVEDNWHYAPSGRPYDDKVQKEWSKAWNSAFGLW